MCHPSDRNKSVRLSGASSPAAGRYPFEHVSRLPGGARLHEGMPREERRSGSSVGLFWPCVSSPTSPDGTVELLLEMYDGVFDALVADKDGKLVALKSAEPSDCPELRDSEEERHFVDWWTTHAKEITTKPAECTPAWQLQYAQSREYLCGALACARKWQLKGNLGRKGPTLLMSYMHSSATTASIGFRRPTILSNSPFIFT